MEFKLEPREVLAHLNKLGYHSVTTEQLRDFIRDLKKLIKFEHQQCPCHSKYKYDQESCVEATEENIPSHLSYSEPASLRPKVGGRVCSACDEISLPQKRTIVRPKSAANVSPWRDDSDSSSTSSNGATSSSSSSSLETYNVPVRVCRKEKLHKEKTRIRSSSVENLHESNKPRSSFIKSWRLLGPVPQPRSDPVAMYHKYQSLWQQQKAPGENAHEGLRWNVRERMLGQDPHPRPVSRASSHEAVWRRRKLV